MNWRIRDSWLAGALCLVALLVYAGSLRNPLVFDDNQLLAERFQRFDIASALRFDLRWISTGSFGWMKVAFGDDWFWQRLLNVLLHASAACGLFFLLRRLFGVLRAADARQGSALAWLGALLFLLHPAAVYGVAYLIQRSIVLAALFSVLSLWFFAEGMVRGRAAWFVASAAAYFLAVFSKEHAVMLPALAAALAILLRRPALPAWRPLVLPFALYAAIGLLAVLKAKGILGAQYEPFGEAAARQLPGAGGSASYALSVLNQGYLFFRYLLLWLLPLPGWMSIDLRPAFPSQLLAWPQAAGFIAWLAWPAAGAALLFRGGRPGLAGFAMLAPWLLALTEVSTVRVQEIFAIYRSYLWMIWLPAALPALLGGLRLRWALAVLGAAALALLAPLHARLATFGTDLAVWDDAVRKIEDPAAPYVDRSYRNRGVAYYQLERYGEALRDFERAIELDPASGKALALRGTLFMRGAQNDRALADFDRALAMDPRDADLLGRRCVVLMRLQRLEDAYADCAAAATLAPERLDSHISLGMVQALRGRTAEAEQEYRRALEIAPEAGIAHYQYGLLLRGLGRREEALHSFAAGCRNRVPQACTAAVP